MDTFINSFVSQLHVDGIALQQGSVKVRVVRGIMDEKWMAYSLEQVELIVYFPQLTSNSYMI